MRRSDREILDPELIDSIIRGAEICRIAMCSNNIPYVVPMNFGYKDGILYLHSAKEGKKIDILRENPRVCFEMESGIELIPGELACDYSMKYYSVIGSGEAFFIEDREEKKKALDVIMEKVTGRLEHVYNEKAVDAVLIIAVSVKELSAKKSRY